MNTDTHPTTSLEQPVLKPIPFTTPAQETAPFRSSKISFVIPVKDEESTLREICQRIAHEMKQLGNEWELLFIDDGSEDGSWEVMRQLREEWPIHVSAHRFRRNCGKAAALALGFREASGDIVFTLDADLQDDPVEIPRFLEKLAEGHDVVTGWKRERHDPWHKVLPSRVFNRMLSRVNGVPLHDHNCGFKCYRREVLEKLPMYGEMHRMVPSLASIEGFRTAEIPVKHHPREHGVSKYGMKRFLRGFMDMWTVHFLKKFGERPQHLYGGLGLAIGIAGLLLTVAALSLPISGTLSTILTTSGPVFLSTGLLLGLVGFVAELQVRREMTIDRPLPVLETLPKEESVRVEVLPRTGTRATATQPTALVVDDDELMRKLVSHRLRKAGWIVVTAASAKHALEAMNDMIDVIFLDLFMPEIDGLSILPSLIRRGQLPQVVMLSSENGARAGAEATRRGAYEYLCKPVNLAEVESTASRALRERSRALTKARLNA